MEENLVRSYSNTKFVDNCNLLLESIGLGTRYVKKGEGRVKDSLRWSQEAEDLDVEN